MSHESGLKMKKIFCIGLNKTGTSSLHKAFQILNIKSVHFIDDKGNNIKDIIINNYLAQNDILKDLENYDAFSDWDRTPYAISIFKEFDKQYPNSKFIVNSRDIKSWLDSREKHVRKNKERKKKYPNEDIVWLEIDIKAWKNEYETHYNEVYSYFKDREKDLLKFDVTKGDGWEKLCPFLGFPILKIPFPKQNIATN